MRSGGGESAVASTGRGGVVWTKDMVGGVEDVVVESPEEGTPSDSHNVMTGSAGPVLDFSGICAEDLASAAGEKRKTPCTTDEKTDGEVIPAPFPCWRSREIAGLIQIVSVARTRVTFSYEIPVGFSNPPGSIGTSLSFQSVRSGFDRPQKGEPQRGTALGTIRNTYNICSENDQLLLEMLCNAHHKRFSPKTMEFPRNIGF